MKRFLFAALLVLVVSAVVVMPAFAMDTCSMDMPGMNDATVTSLTMHVQHAADPMMGHIDPTLVTALLAPLKTAANTTLPVTARAGALQAFTYLVNAQAGKGINADCAAHLVAQAQAITLR